MKRYLIALILVSMIFPVSSAFAIGSEKGPWEKYSVSLGGFVTSINSSVRFGSESLGAGLEVDLEEGLGLDASTTIFRFDALGRYGSDKKHRVDFSYFYYDRDATKTIQANIDFGDISLIVGDTVDTTFNIEIIKLGYSYSLLMDDRMNISVGGGIYVMPIESEIFVQGSGSFEEEDITAPLPALNLRADFVLTEKSYLRQGIDIFYLEYGDYRGAVIGLNISYEYLINDNFSLGVGLDSLRVQVEAEGSDDFPGLDLNGDIKFGYSGLMFFAKYYF